MKRWNLWYCASGLIQVLCVMHILQEWFHYSNAFNSAPFSVTVWLNVICFGVPAAVCFLVGLYLEKNRKDDSHE